MIKKANLLGKIDELLAMDKSIVPLLNKHISSSLFFSVLKGPERKAILDNFQKMVITKTKHIEALNSIRSEIAKGKSDVY